MKSSILVKTTPAFYIKLLLLDYDQVSQKKKHLVLKQKSPGLAS